MHLYLLADHHRSPLVALACPCLQLPRAGSDVGTLPFAKPDTCSPHDVEVLELKHSLPMEFIRGEASLSSGHVSISETKTPAVHNLVEHLRSTRVLLLVLLLLLLLLLLRTRPNRLFIFLCIFYDTPFPLAPACWRKVCRPPSPRTVKAPPRQFHLMYVQTAQAMCVD